jgi:hypothetical protein
MQKEGRTCDRIWNRIDYISDTLPSFRHFVKGVEAYDQTTLMRYFGMTRDRYFDGLTDAEDLRDLVHRGLDERTHPEFFEWSQQDLQEFCRKNYPDNNKV